MFFCPTCGSWIAQTIVSQLLSKETDAALHRLVHTNPQLAAALQIVAPVAVGVVAVWATSKIRRWLRA